MLFKYVISIYLDHKIQYRGCNLKSIMVKGIMVPLSAYATVSEEANLYEAIMALEAAQEKFGSSRYAHRAILILGPDDNVVGKVDMVGILSALEPKYDQIGDPGIMSRTGINPDFLRSMVEKYSLWDKPLQDICAKAVGKKVKNFMYTPTEGEHIEEDATLDDAIHLLVLGNHQSLLVTKDDKITGILRLTDVFSHVCELTKTCEI